MHKCTYFHKVYKTILFCAIVSIRRKEKKTLFCVNGSLTKRSKLWSCQNSQVKAICSTAPGISINPCSPSQSESGLHLSFLIQMKMCNVQHQCGMTREPAVPSRATASQCDVKRVLHFGACGFDSRMFYCRTMFLSWSAAACIKSILSLSAQCHPQLMHVSGWHIAL